MGRFLLVLVILGVASSGSAPAEPLPPGASATAASPVSEPVETTTSFSPSETSTAPTSSEATRPEPVPPVVDLLGCAEYSGDQVDGTARVYLNDGGLTIETVDKEFWLTQDDPVCRGNPDAVQILQTSGAWAFDVPAKQEFDCSDYDASVLLEHNNILISGTVIYVDSATSRYTLDSTDQACLDNPDAVELFIAEGVLGRSRSADG